MRGDVDRQRPRGDARHREDGLGVGGEPGGAARDQILDAGLGRVLGRARELGDDVRVAAGRGDDGIGALGVAAEAVDELARVRIGQRGDVELARVVAHGGAARPPPHPRDDAEVVLRAMREHDLHARVGALDELGEEHRAVGVAPVDVVDEHDQRADRREPGEHAVQRVEAAAADLLRIRWRWRQRRQLGEPGHPAQHGEQADQRAEVARRQRLDVRRGLADDHRGELVDDAVEHLERHRLALEAAALEDERGVAEAAQERADQRGLADAAAAAHHHRDARAARVGERGLQLVQLAVAADERGVRLAARELARRRRHRRAEPEHHVAPARPHRRVGVDELGGESRASSASTAGSSASGVAGCSVCLRTITCSASPSIGRRPASAS